MTAPDFAPAPPGRFPQADLDVIRCLAERVAAIARTERMRAIVKRWRDANELEQPDRAPVWCRPVGCWKELLPDDSLACNDPFLRGIEKSLRQTLVKEDIGDDSIVHPWHEVPLAFDVEPENVWGVEIARHQSGTEGGAWGYKPAISSEEGLRLLRFPKFRHNAQKTEERREATEEALGDALPIRLGSGSAFLLRLSATIGRYVAGLLGMSEMMLLMATDPGLVHRVTRHVADAVKESNRWMEEEGLLARNNDAPMTYSDNFGPELPDGAVSLKNLWCAANSQEYDQISPAMWEEFCLEYQRPILAEFGRVAYGCCENLTHKLDGVTSLPNLRLLVCSAWTDLDAAIEKSEGRCAVMWRQKASDVVLPNDLAPIRRDLEEGTKKLKGRPYQIVLRELQTLAGHPDRLKEWTRLAIEAAERNG